VSLNKYNKIEITPYILSDHNKTKLELNNKNTKKLFKHFQIAECQWIIKEIMEDNQKYLESNENEITTYQNLWNTVKEVLREKNIPMSTSIKNTEAY
jgi:hypothetical protein